MKIVRSLLVAFVSITCLMAADCDTDVIAPDAVPALLISPSGAIDLFVGDRIQVVASATNTIGPVVFATSNPAVAAVDANLGVVTCVAPGLATITASATATTTVLRQSMTVRCSARPSPPPTTLVEVTGGPIRFTHVVGGTSCPQRIGTITVRNSSNEPTQIAITCDSPAVNMSPVNFTLAAGASRELPVTFNCGTRRSFEATINVTATSGDRKDSKTVGVVAEIK